MKINKRLLTVTGIIIFLPSLLGIFLWDKLPERLASHFNIASQADGYSDKAFIIFGLSSLMFAFHCLLLFLMTRDPKSQNISEKMRKISYWLLPVLSIAIFSNIYLAAFKVRISTTLMSGLLLGLLFISIGNYLPKLQQNYTIGIRLPWTLDDEENWNRTHRLTGRLWVAGGSILLLNGFLKWAYLPVAVLVLAVLILVPLVYSFWLYQKNS